MVIPVTTPLDVTAPAFHTPVVIVLTLVSEPSVVIAGCEAAVTVAALPLALPVNAPVNVVAATEVRPVIVAGNDRVTAPVLAEAVILLAVPVIDVTAPAEVT